MKNNCLSDRVPLICRRLFFGFVVCGSAIDISFFVFVVLLLNTNLVQFRAAASSSTRIAKRNLSE